jgi:saccharopine dehydrogenase (NAD+, L-lysine-forming)
MESIVKHIPTIRKAQFWMTFSDNYLKHLEVLQNVGMTRIDEVEYNGQKIVPLQFLKAVLPDPASLGPLTKGRTCIGVIARGLKDGKRKQVYIYNICDHEKCYKEVNSQAISYTTGVPAVVGGIMMLTGQWHKPGVWNMEQFDPQPFLDEVGPMGLPYVVVEGEWPEL